MKYIYDGSVTEYGTEICRRWHGETTAPSLAKAVSNLKYQYNKQHNRLPYCKIELNTKNIKMN